MPNISSGSISLADINAQFGIPATTQIDMGSGITLLGGGSTPGAVAQMSDFFYRQAGLQQDGKAVGTQYVFFSNQGKSVALSADGNTLAVGGESDKSQKGATWIFTKSGNGWLQQGDKLVGVTASSATLQGESVALSADGNTLAVGGNIDDSGIGAVWIFTRTNGIWTQQGNKLVGGGYVLNVNGISQGCSVSLSADGNTLAVGGFRDASSFGATWIFTRANGVWTQQGNKLVGNGSVGTSPYQGSSVSLSADGNTLASSGQNDDSGIGAVWVFTRTDGIWSQQGSKLVGTGAVGSAQQGQSVKLSADGNTLAVGGYYDNTDIGAVWVFTRTAGIWTQQGSKLVGTGYTVGGLIPYVWQGWSVALSEDGNTLAVGGSYDNNGRGACWIFKRTGSVWAQESSKLKTSQVTTAQIAEGTSVALSADGNILCTGAPYQNSSVGAAFTFTRSGSTWSEPNNTSKVTSTDATDRQGRSVRLSADGNTLAVGCPTDSTSVGATLIFTRTAGVWTQQGGKLVGSGYIGSPQQGDCISLSADGNTLAIGAANDNSNNGACWVFTRTAGVWTQQGDKIVGVGLAATSNFGRSVVLSADGNTLAVGASVDDNIIGSVCVFTRTAGVWTQQGSKLVGTGYVLSSSVNQGRSVALSADGNTLAVGANGEAIGRGAIWIFTRTAGVWTQQGGKIAGTVGAYLGYFVSLSADGNTLAVGAPGSSGASGGSYVFTRTAGVWTQQGSKLVGTGGVGNNYQGWSVALTADGNALAVGAYADSTSQGAVWIFTRTNGVWTQQGSKIVTSGSNGRNLGYSVSFSGNGNTLAAGCPVSNSTWIFT